MRPNVSPVISSGGSARWRRGFDVDLHLQAERGEVAPERADAAASLLEGLEEMFTAARLGITGTLRRSLTNTNCIESMISTVRVVPGRVKTWKDGDMKKRWIATGMIDAQRSFRRVRGHTQMTNLVTVIGHAINPVTPDNYTQAVA